MIQVRQIYRLQKVRCIMKHHPPLSGPVSYRRLSKDAEPFQKREDIAHLKALLAFVQGREAR